MKALQSPPKQVAKNRAKDYRRQQAGDWINLPMLPSPYSFSEGLLLCEIESGQWLVWVPDYGELTVSLQASINR
jgi:hypothetical protein